MNGSASAPWRRSQRRLQGRLRLISPRSVIVDPRQLGVPWGTVPIIVADASAAFCQLGHRGANKTDAMEPSCDAAPAPSIGTMNSRRFIRSPRPRSAREYRCRDGQRVGSSVRADATSARAMETAIPLSSIGPPAIRLRRALDRVQGRPRHQVEADPGPHLVYGFLTTAPNAIG
jgi:hypothetical protein